MSKKEDILISEILDRYDELSNDIKGYDEDLDKLLQAIENLNQYLSRD